MNIIKTTYYSLVPLLILLFFVSFSALLSYIILMIAGDIISMRKIVSKGAQIFLLLSIFPFRHYLKLTWADIGFATRPQFFKQLGYGMVLGLLTLMPVMITLYIFDINVIDQTKEWTASKIIIRALLALLLATLISFGEEPIFSGILLAGLRKKMMVGLAAFVSATYYAAFHFVKTKTDIPYEELSIGSGFQLMAEAFANVINPEIASAFVALLAVGLFLATIRTQFSNSIGICIGCHAAWVWQIKLGKDFFNTNLNSDYSYLVSSYYDGVVGWLVAVWLSLAIVSFFIWKKFLYRQES
ncbi:MAG: CPBP family glutamic-type intramembrane protease [Methylococcaceae bacterium]|nr:CPBP family glutamic-type intramembrane protease [Methylococcaceae bacterium]